MGYSRKNLNRAVEEMEFPGVLKKENVEIPGVNFKKSRISRGVQAKTHVEFHGSCFLTLEFPKGVTEFCRISRSESFFSLEFLRVKSQI